MALRFMLTPRKTSSVTCVKFPPNLRDAAAGRLSCSHGFLRRLERGRFLRV